MTIRPDPNTRSAQRLGTDLSAYDAPTADLTKIDHRVHDGECLYCYLVRMLDAFGCRDGDHRFTKRWIDSQQRRHGWVLGWVKKNGGCCCDCEVIFNVFRDDRNSQRHQQLRCAASYFNVEDGDNDNEDDDRSRYD